MFDFRALSLQSSEFMPLKNISVHADDNGVIQLHTVAVYFLL